MSKNPKISKNLTSLFFYLKILKIFFSPKKKFNYILLVLQIEEISLRPELSSLPRFRIQGGYPKREGGLTEIVVSNIGCYYI